MESPNHLVKIILSGTICAILVLGMFVILQIPIIQSSEGSDATFTIRENIEKLLHIKTTFLKDVVSSALSGGQGDYAVSIKNLKSNESYSLNADKVYDAASLYKLWVMAVAYQQIQQGKLNPDEVLADDVQDLNERFNIASEEAELTDGSVSFTVRDALNQMITISHNYAALLLTEKVGGSNIAAFLKENGMNNSLLDIDGYPKTNAHDTALFLEKLYKGELANKKYTDEMISLLKNQQRNNKIPKNLPKETEVAHKTGEIDGVTHDAGIVYLPNTDYIIVVLSNSDYPPGAEDRIASLSEAVYNYFKNE